MLGRSDDPHQSLLPRLNALSLHAEHSDYPGETCKGTLLSRWVPVLMRREQQAGVARLRLENFTMHGMGKLNGNYINTIHSLLGELGEEGLKVVIL